MRAWFGVVSFLFLVSILSCGTGPSGSALPAPEVTANTEVSESFGVSRDLATSELTVVLRRAALEKEFLLQGSVLGQLVAPMGSSFRSRIVAFRRIGKKIILLEATEGHTVTRDVPQHLVLGSFDILRIEGDQIHIDFNSGMQEVYAAREWGEHSKNGRKYKPAFDSKSLRFAFLDDVRLLGSHLFIRQIAQIDQGEEGVENAPVEVRYILTPYAPDPSFVPSSESEHRNASYFESAPRLQPDGSLSIRAIRWDARKPIVFAVSPNTPERFRQAVRDGILYWKGALPTIEAIDAPEGVSAPHPQYNVIQWVAHDDAGYAFADAQVDPRTGQVLHAQAYITSFFALDARNSIRAALRNLEPSSTPAAKQSLALCSRTADSSMRVSLGARLSPALSDAVILRVAQDYIRATVAHEVGHLLGLRHNFAGSLAPKNYPLEKRDEIFVQYLERDIVPHDLETASSEMDYLPFEESTLHGHQMRTRPGSMYGHDRLAIEMHYFGKRPTAAETFPFCTEAEESKYFDCRDYDSGSSFVEFSAASVKKAIESAPKMLVEKFIAAKAPRAWEKPVPIRELNLDPADIARPLISPLEDLISSFSNRRSVLVARTFPFIGPLTEDLIKQKETALVEAELERLGGWEGVFVSVGARGYETFFNDVENLLSNPSYRSGVGLAGQPYRFSDDEVEQILETTLDLLIRLPEKVSKSEVDLLKSIPDKWKISGNKAGDSLAEFISKRSREYLLTPRPALSLRTEIDLSEALPDDPMSPDKSAFKSIQVNLPEFFYAQEIREKAATLLAMSGNADGIDWGFAEKSSLKEDFKKTLEKACGCEFSKVNVEKIKVADAPTKKKVTRWFLQNKKVLNAVP